jgi:hypothetical protein
MFWALDMTEMCNGARLEDAGYSDTVSSQNPGGISVKTMAKLWKVVGSVKTILCSAARCRFNCGAHIHQVENVAFDIDLNLKANMRLPARNLRTLVEASPPIRKVHPRCV